MKKTLLILLLLLFSFEITTYRVSAEIFEEGIIAALDDEDEEDEVDEEEEEEDVDEEDEADEEEEKEDVDNEEENNEDEENESGEVSTECDSISEGTIKTLYMGSYSDVPYCSGNDRVSGRGCYVVTLASILNSFGSEIQVSDIANYLCTNFTSDITHKPVSYSNVSPNTEFHNHFNFEMNKIGGSIDAVNSALDSGNMIMLSVVGANEFASSSAGHYIAIAMHNGEQYYIINTNENSAAGSGWYPKSTVERMLSQISQGPYAVRATSCIKSGSSSGNTPNSSIPSRAGNNKPVEVKFYDFGDGDGISCDSLENFFEALKGIYTLIKIAAPVLVIVLSTMEYIRAIAASNTDDVKKTHSRTIKRIIVGLIIFFLPDLLDLLFHIFGIYNINGCNIGM